MDNSRAPEKICISRSEGNGTYTSLCVQTESPSNTHHGPPLLWSAGACSRFVTAAASRRTPLCSKTATISAAPADGRVIPPIELHCSALEYADVLQQCMGNRPVRPRVPDMACTHPTTHNTSMAICRQATQRSSAPAQPRYNPPLDPHPAGSIFSHILTRDPPPSPAFPVSTPAAAPDAAVAVAGIGAVHAVPRFLGTPSVRRQALGAAGTRVCAPAGALSRR